MNLKKFQEKDLILQTQQQLLNLDQRVKNGELCIEQIADLIPGNLMIQDLEALKVIHINKSGTEYLRHDLMQLQELGGTYYDKFFHPEEAPQLFKETISFLQKQDESAVHSLLQRVRPDANSDYEWFITSLKYFRRKGGSKEIILISQPVSNLGFTTSKINRLVEEDKFMKTYYHKFMRLTLREKEIIGLLVAGESTSEISDRLSISKFTVNAHRRSIGSKLEIKNFAGLLKYALAFDLA